MIEHLWLAFGRKINDETDMGKLGVEGIWVCKSGL